MRKLDPGDVKRKIESLGLSPLSAYEKASKPMTLQCSKGHEFKRTWNSIQSRDAVNCPCCTGRSGQKARSDGYVKDYFRKYGYTATSKYSGAHFKVSYVCPLGHEGSMSWTNFSMGRRCAVCAGRVISQELLEKEFEAEGYKVVSQYQVGEKIAFDCPNGHRHSISIGSWRHGIRCGKCHSVPVEMKDVTDSFEAEGYAIASKGMVGRRVHFVCPEGHHHDIDWHAWKTGRRCGKCRSVDPQEVKNVFESNGYTLIEGYKSSSEKISFICPEGHSGQMIWKTFKDGGRCFQCKGTYVTQEQAQASLKERGLILKSEYINESSELHCWCEEGHHEHVLTWAQFRHRRRCMECHPSLNAFSDHRPGSLYYVVFDVKGERVYKIGITSLSVEDRFRREKHPFRILSEKRYLWGYLARAEESRLLRKYKKFAYSGSPLRYGGNTELFRKDVLGLDQLSS